MRFLYEWKLALGLPTPTGRVAERWSDLPKCPLTSTARHVARVLSEHMDGDGADCRPSGELVARETGYSLSTVWKALDELERKGYVRRFATSHSGGKGGRHCTTLYVPTIPETVRESDSFRAVTVRRSERNRPSNTRKQSDRRTQGLRGLHKASDSAPPEVPAPPSVIDDCMNAKCGRRAPLTDLDGVLLCEDCGEVAKANKRLPDENIANALANSTARWCRCDPKHPLGTNDDGEELCGSCAKPIPDPAKAAA